MNILMITQFFYPEPNHLKGLSFAKELSKNGHNLIILTGFPNYPKGKIYTGYKQKLFSKEIIDGINIIRAPLYIDHSASSIKRILCYLSFAFTSSVVGCFLLSHIDVIYVYQGPATLAIPAMLYKILFNKPYLLDIQDLWPESVSNSGMMKSEHATKIINKYCNITYQMANKIVVLSNGYKSLLVNRNVNPDKIKVIYNWCDENQIMNIKNDTICSNLITPNNFNIIYAGNFGKLQALSKIIKVAEYMEKNIPKIIFYLIGDGVEESQLKNQVNNKRLKNVIFIPRQSVSDIVVLLRKADGLIIHLVDRPICNVGIPQKVQAYMAIGKPLIAAIKGDALEVVKTAKCGVVCEPENLESIICAVKKLYGMSFSERNIMGQRGQRYYRENFSFDIGVKKIIDLLRQTHRD